MKANLTRPKGFTLIELLVVIAIIALLAAILFPVFARARENARKTSCLNNQKQLALGFLQYAQDFDETLPNSTDGIGNAAANGGEGTIGGWNYYSVFGAPNGKFDVTKGSIFPYVKSNQVYLCPSDSVGQKTGDSYAINACMVETTRTLGIRNGKALSYFNNTSMYMLTGEETSGGSTDDGYMAINNAWTARHLQGTIISFLDGHTKFVLVENNHLQPVNYQTGGVGGPGAACP